MPQRLHNVLFLCRTNSARSIFAEAILTELGSGRFRAYSAGSKPQRSVKPQVLNVLHLAGHDVSELHPKNYREFIAPGAPAMDVVIDLSDELTGGITLRWPGDPVIVRWDVPGPSRRAATTGEAASAFDNAYRAIWRSIGQLTALPLASLDKVALGNSLEMLKRSAGLTSGPLPH